MSINRKDRLCIPIIGERRLVSRVLLVRSVGRVILQPKKIPSNILEFDPNRKASTDVAEGTALINSLPQRYALKDVLSRLDRGMEKPDPQPPTPPAA